MFFLFIYLHIYLFPFLFVETLIKDLYGVSWWSSGKNTSNCIRKSFDEQKGQMIVDNKIEKRLVPNKHVLFLTIVEQPEAIEDID